MSIAGLGEIAERVRRFTVLVEPGGRGSGSGVVWSTDGLVVTNALELEPHPRRWPDAGHPETPWEVAAMLPITTIWRARKPKVALGALW